MRIIPAALLTVAGLLAAADPQPPVVQQPATPKPVAPQDQAMAGRIAELEAEISKLVGDQARSAGPAGAAAAPDYNEAKARVSADIRRRLDMVEYVLADNDYARAIDGCNSILVDHPHEPATTRLKYRILTAMVERERAQIERERAYRADEAMADGQRKTILPREAAMLARTVWVFDEDIQEAERQAVRKRLQEKLTLNYDGVKVGEVLKPLFAVAGINYIILDKALSEDTLTLHLVDDTVENALITISKLVKVHYNYSANTVFIGSEDSDVLVSEVIHLQSGLTDVTSQIEMGDAASGGGGSRGTGSGSTARGGGSNRPSQGGAAGAGGAPGGGQASSDLEKLMDKVPDLIVGWPTEGKWYLDRKSNTLYVRATPYAIAEVKRLIKTLDYNNAQILIEARFVELTEEASRSLGVDWGGGASSSSLTVGSTMGGGVQAPQGGLTFAPVQTPIGAATMGGSGLNLGMLFSPNGALGIKMAINALEKDDKASQLAEPRILTLNNATGTIKLTQTVSYIERYDYQSGTSNTGTDSNGNVTNVSTQNPIPQWQQEDEGITLRIRPSIARNSDVITLEVQPTVRELVSLNPTIIQAQSSAGTTAQSLTVQKPDFRERSLATTLHIKNGQTVVMGGLTRDATSNGTSGVPGLSRMPLLGGLFSSRTSGVKRANLLIFVTAHIIDPSGAKIGEEIRRLRDTAAVVMPEEVRLAEAEMKAVEVQRAAAADAAAKEAAERGKSTPPPTRGGRR